jgi:acetyl-CoA carboxylase biotin carboxyl carrier protein
MLNELIDLVGRDNVREIEVERRFLGGRIRVTGASPEPASRPDPGPVPAREEREPEVVGPVSPTAADADGLHTVASPLVGLFFRASAPDAPPYVEEGDMVTVGQTLCVIETMKIMNEIEADAAGRISRILAENGRPVEYNTPLFLIEPQ